MNFNHRALRTFALTVAFGLGPLLAFQSPATAPDNTKMNSGQQTTADQAHNGKSDVKIMAEIRRSVVKDKTLSVYAHNVKIVSTHGKVILKGVVHSDDEKKNIEAKAVAVAGDGNVDDQLTVKGDSK